MANLQTSGIFGIGFKFPPPKKVGESRHKENLVRYKKELQKNRRPPFDHKQLEARCER